MPHPVTSCHTILDVPQGYIELFETPYLYDRAKNTWEHGRLCQESTRADCTPKAYRTLTIVLPCACEAALFICMRERWDGSIVPRGTWSIQ